MQDKINILLLEDSEADAELEILELRRNSLQVNYLRADTKEQMLAYLDSQQWDIIISDYVMPSFSALEAIRLVKEKQLDIPLIVVSGTIGEDVAVDTMKAGATDYIMKGNLKRLAQAVLREIKESRIRNQKKIAEAELKKSEENFRQIAENIEEVIWLHNREMNQLLYISPAYEKIWGKPSQGLYENPVSFLDSIHPDDKELIEESVKNLLNNTLFDYEFRIIRPDKTIRWVETRIFPIRNSLNEITRFVGIAEDITQRKDSQHKLEQSLSEKETLLRELYHRTKNNMQVISSILYLQSNFTQDQRILSVYKEISSRINAISLVHQKLYSSKSLSTLYLDEYIEELAHLILNCFGIDLSQIKLILEIEKIPVLIDIATPFGLVINELMTNTLKYAFPDGNLGTITLKIKKTAPHELEVLYQDNGIGFPEHFDFENVSTLGFTIFNSIVRDQLKGEVQFNGKKGFTAVMKIKTNLYDERV